MAFVCLFVCHVSSSYNFSYFHSDDDRNVDDGDTKKKKGLARWRDYFDDDWDPDDDDRTVDDEDRSVEDDNRNLDDEDEKKKVKKGQARWRIHLHF